ncbi:MAG: lipid IV(A) 3-deoxy-D-manno-octulosonic acid transferase [Vibrionaceae bacterium]
MRFIYTLLLALAAPFLLVGLFKKKQGKPHVGKRWVEHFGFTPALNDERTQRPIWLHAVSVGEVIAAKPLILKLQERYPQRPILVTTTTATGAAMAAQIANVHHRYMPLDFPFAIKRFIKRFQPAILLIMETELWPNTLACAQRAQIDVLIINGRLSDKACANYQKIRPFFTTIARNISHICCQFAKDRENFQKLGISDEKLSTTGSLKFDLPHFDVHAPRVVELQSQIGARPVWVAASTHHGEDALLLEAHRLLLKTQPQALLILAPRHPERFSVVFEQILSQNFTAQRRTQQQTLNAQTQVYLADTLGDMMMLFACADVAFMAGSLLGDKVGGHNLLEPASLAKPLLSGPSYFNFQTIGDELIAAKAYQICQDPAQISQQLQTLFADAKLREQAGAAALSVVEKNRGAIQQTLAILPAFLKP